jgi:hypothetical protein
MSGQRIKAFSAINVAYLCLAALAQAGLSHELDLTHFLESLIAVGPLVLLPGVLLLLCVSGRVTRRAVVPIAFGAVLVALPLAIYTSLTASCHMLHTIDTCI